MRVMLTHNPEDRAAYYGRALPELRALAEVTINPFDRDMTTSELIATASDCDVIVSHRSTHGPAAVFEESPQLLAFLRCAVDISDVDVDGASNAGVLVAHADKSFVPSTAELALALMLDLVRNVSESTVDYRNGVEPPQRPGRQLRGMTAGIIGHGAIGSYLAGVLRGLGVEVLITDPHSDAQTHALDDLLAGSDFVLPLAPATEETVDLIGARELGLMKRGAFLINVSRGELVNETAVTDALDRNHLGGVGMDVGRATDQRPSLALAARSNVVATPHLGGLTPENADAQAASSVEQVRAMLNGEIPPRAVNADAAVRLRAYWDS